MVTFSNSYPEEGYLSVLPLLTLSLLNSTGLSHSRSTYYEHWDFTKYYSSFKDEYFIFDSNSATLDWSLKGQPGKTKYRFWKQTILLNTLKSLVLASIQLSFQNKRNFLQLWKGEAASAGTQHYPFYGTKAFLGSIRSFSSTYFFCRCRSNHAKMSCISVEEFLGGS